MFESSIEQSVGIVFAQYGVPGVVTILVLLLLIRYADPIKKALAKFTRGRVVSSQYNSKEVLLSKITYWTEFKINHLNIIDNGRRAIFKDLLMIKFLTFKDYINKSHTIYTNKMGSSELYTAIVTCFNESIGQYNVRAKELKIPDIVLSKFNEWQIKSFEFTLKSAELICYSNVYGNNDMRIQAVFSLFTAMMELTIAEAEKTLTDLNGELSGIEYKGVVCG